MVRQSLRRSQESGLTFSVRPHRRRIGNYLCERRRKPYTMVSNPEPRSIRVAGTGFPVVAGPINCTSYCETGVGRKLPVLFHSPEEQGRSSPRAGFDHHRSRSAFFWLWVL
jgi:hypothetical protein